MSKKVYVVLGPTATGKTEYGVKLAKSIGGEVISADSMQIYRGMDIGTAKPSPGERDGVAHHMIDIVDPDEDYSVALYQLQAKAVIEGIFARCGVPVVVGGTGLYINSLTHGLEFSGGRDEALRDRLSKLSAGELYALLLEKDPDAAKRIHPNNVKRVVRAIEVAGSGKKPYDFEKRSEEYEFDITGLHCERGLLYSRINARVDKMMENGLADEASGLYKKYGMDVYSMQGIGYKEFAPYFDGNADLDEVADTIKLNTRHFAKRQMTWFKRDMRIKWIDIAEL